MILKVTITTLEVLTLTLVILCPLIRIIESFDLSDELNCINCIGGISASLGIDTGKKCEQYYCGQFQLSYTYWADAGKPGSNGGAKDFEKCAKDRACAEQTVRAYFKKHKRDCDGDGTDMAALHRGGPSQCNASWIYTTRYWTAFNKSQCMDYKINGLAGEQDYLIDKRAKNESLTSECLDCICEAIAGCNMNVTNCSGGNVCGPFGISQAYWKDGKRPGSNWMVCAKSKECSGVTMRNYMEKYKRDCNNDGVITCNDYAAIHRRGPQGCGSKDLQKDPYWNRFLTCRVNFKPTTDTNTVTLQNGIDGHDLISRTELLGTSPSPAVASIPLDTILAQDSNNNKQGQTTFATSTTTLKLPDLVQVVPATIAHHPILPQQQPQQTQQTNQVGASGGSGGYEMKTPWIITRNKIASNSVTQDRPMLFGPSSTTPYPREIVNPIIPSNLDKDPHTLRSKETHRPVYQLLSTVKPTTSTTTTTTTSTTTTTTTTLAPTTLVPTTESPMTTTVPMIDQTTLLPNQNQEIQATTSPTEPTFIQQQFNDTIAPDDSSATNSSVDFSPPMPTEINISQDSPDMTTQSVIDKMSHSILATFLNPHQPIPNIVFTTDKTVTSLEKEPVDPLIEQLPIRGQIIATKSNNKQQSTYLVSSPNSSQTQEILFPEDNTTRISSECLGCICEASSNCVQTVRCTSMQRDKNRCGPYMITWDQYKESDIALTSFTTLAPDLSQEQQQNLEEKAFFDCTTNRECAERLIHLYIEKHERDCNGDGKINCYDVAALHRVGPSQCNSQKFLDSQYWKDFTGCYNLIAQRRKRSPASMRVSNRK